MRLTIGMAVYDDFDGCYFTLQALKIYHGLAEDVEIVVVDNHPKGCQETKKAVNAVGGRYLRRPDCTGTTAPRDLVFREAKGEVVLCVDCHVLLWPGATQHLLDYFAVKANARDMLHGVLVYDDHKGCATHMKPEWGGHMLGVWADDLSLRAGSEPREIPMHGLGLFAMRKDAWVGFNEHFRGFGGEEGYVHEKVRRAGGKVVCHPAVRWTHRFGRPHGVPYRLDLADRFFNYLVGHRELGLDDTPVRDQFVNDLPVARQNAILTEVNRLYPETRPMTAKLATAPAKKILGCFYTDNSVHQQIMDHSIASIVNSRSNSSGAEVKLAACSWKTLPTCFDWQFRSHQRGNRSHFTLVSQVLRNLYETAAWKPDYVCFLEHDVLYPPDYFDRVLAAFVANPRIKVVHNTNYIGMSHDGYQQLVRDDKPMHQLSMTAAFARTHFEGMLRRAIVEGCISIEPRDTAMRAVKPAGPAAVHINHSNNLTSHFECYETALLGGNPVTTVEHWGNFGLYYPDGERSRQRDRNTSTSGV